MINKEKEIKKHNLGRVQITRDCNQNCVFCSAPPEGEELSLSEFKKKIYELKELGTTDLMLTGGETTIKYELTAKGMEAKEMADIKKPSYFG